MKEIVQTLTDKGFSAYFAGGCVRDMILGLTPKDIDVATSATPDEVESIFKRTIPVGKQFGVIVVLMGDEQIEVATFRNDGNYTDGRRPDGVNFSTPQEDAKRRDLTINGMFYDPLSGDILDFVGGQEDIKNKTIRFIGNPQERIDEDRLRILRAIRFACKLGFDFDINTLLAIEKNAHRITDVSPERIKDELDKMLSTDKPSMAIQILHNVGILKYVLPEVDNLWNCEQNPKWHAEGNAGIHTLKVLDETRKVTDDLITLWAALLHDIGKPLVVAEDLSCKGHDKAGAELSLEVLRRLKASNEEKEMVSSIIADHMRIGAATHMKKSTLRRLTAQSNFDRLLTVYQSDCLGTTPSDESVDKLSGVRFLREFIANPKNNLPKPFITGKHLIDLGIKPGPLFKEILKDIMDRQLEGEINSEDDGLIYLRSVI